MLTSLWDIFGSHLKMFVVFAGLVVLLCSVYFYINKERKAYTKYYLAGYLVVLSGIVVSLIRIYFNVRSLGLMITSLALYLSGFAVVLYGGYKRRELSVLKNWIDAKEWLILFSRKKGSNLRLDSDAPKRRVRRVFYLTNSMDEIRCAYCGVTVQKPDREDVIPKNLYTLSKSKSKIQRIKVPSCNPCNNSFSDDEAHFRNIMTLAGKPGPITLELWEKVEGSLDKKDGKKRLLDIYRQMKPVGNSGSGLYKVYPGKDEKGFENSAKGSARIMSLS